MEGRGGSLLNGNYGYFVKQHKWGDADKLARLVGGGGSIKSNVRFGEDIRG